MTHTSFVENTHASSSTSTSLHNIEIDKKDGTTERKTVKLAKGSTLPGKKFTLNFEQIRKGKTSHFKTEVFKKKVVPYNFVQHFLFLDVTVGIVEPKNSAYFEEDDDNSTGQSNNELYEYPYDIFGDDMYENDYFMKQGRVIGNLTLSPDPKVHAARPSLSKLLLSAPKAMSYDRGLSDRERMAPADSLLAAPLEQDCIACVDGFQTKLPVETPVKFITMLHDILAQKKQKQFAHAVVYSSYRKNGIHAFLRFVEGLKENTEIDMPFQHKTGSEFFTKLVCKFYDPNLDPRKPVVHADAKGDAVAVIAEMGEPNENEPYDVLFLEPSMTEGVSIHRGECLHIMQPIINPNMMDQLKARVNRYNHTGFDTEKKVRVVLYECSAKKHINKLMNKMKHWGEKTDRGRIFWRRFKIFNQDLSPDFLVHQKAEKLRYTIKQLSEMLVHACSLNHTKIIYSKLEHKNYIVEDIDGRNRCAFCRATQKKTAAGLDNKSGGARGRLRRRTRRRTLSQRATRRTRQPH
jgi:hypothetical protein